MGKKYFIKDKRTEFTKLAITKLISRLNQPQHTIDNPPWESKYYPNSPGEQWLLQIIQTWLIYKCSIQSEYNQNNKNISQKTITSRQIQLNNNKKAIIKSIFNKGSSNIDLSKIILKQPNLRVILDPTDIKNRITDHYANIINKNNTSDQTEWNIWSSEYTPKSTINPDWYNTIFQPITVQEIQGVINKTKAESASGLSCINYAIFKHLGFTTIKRIYLIFNQIITTQQIPNHWQKNLVHPIPKK